MITRRVWWWRAVLLVGSLAALCSVRGQDSATVKLGPDSMLEFAEPDASIVLHGEDGGVRLALEGNGNFSVHAGALTSNESVIVDGFLGVESNMQVRGNMSAVNSMVAHTVLSVRSEDVDYRLTESHDAIAAFDDFTSVGGAPAFRYPGEFMQVESDKGFRLLNLSLVHNKLREFRGGFCSGYACFMVPNVNGMVAMVDTSRRVAYTSAWSVMDLEASFGELGNGFWGGFAADDWAYLVPHMNDGGAHGMAVRIQISSFPGTAEKVFLNDTHPSLVGFMGGCVAEQWAVYTPHETDDDYHGLLTRVDRDDFTTTGVWYVNLTDVHGSLRGFSGAAAADTSDHVYLAPARFSDAFSMLVRVSMGDFTTGGVEYFDAAGYSAAFAGFSSLIVVDNHVYYTPFYQNDEPHGIILQLSEDDFSTGGLGYINVTALHGGLRGYSDVAATPNGDYIYISPYSDAQGPHGRVLRVDPAMFWDSSSAVTTVFLSGVDSDASGFHGVMVSDSFAGFLVPHYHNLAAYFIP